MRHAAENGAELVRRLMAFARKQELTPTSVNPRALCDSVAGLVEHTLGKTIAVEWHVPDQGLLIYRRSGAVGVGAGQPPDQRA